LEQVVDIVQKLGFPIFVCFYFMFEMRKVILKLAECIGVLEKTIRDGFKGDLKEIDNKLEKLDEKMEKIDEKLRLLGEKFNDK
jgi:hypothetical protein